MSKSVNSRIIRFVALLLPALLSFPLVAAGQADDELELLKHFPLQYLKPESVQMSLEQLQWQSDRLGMSSAVLRDRIDQAQDELLNYQTSRAELVESLPPEFRFADDKARSEAASRCLQELLTLRLDQASHTALLEDMQQNQLSDADRTRLDLQKKQIEAQIRYRESEMALAKSSLDGVTSLVEKQMASESEVRKAETALMQARTSLETELLNFQILEQEAGAPISREMAEVRRQIHALDAREQAARHFLKQLNETAILSQRIRRLDEDVQIKQEILNRLNMQQLELQNELDEIRVLQMQVNEALKLMPDGDENRDQD